MTKHIVDYILEAKRSPEEIRAALMKSNKEEMVGKRVVPKVITGWLRRTFTDKRGGIELGWVKLWKASPIVEKLVKSGAIEVKPDVGGWQRIRLTKKGAADLG